MVTAVFRPAAIVHTPYQAPAAIFCVYNACSFHSGESSRFWWTFPQNFRLSIDNNVWTPCQRVIESIFWKILSTILMETSMFHVTVPSPVSKASKNVNGTCMKPWITLNSTISVAGMRKYATKVNPRKKLWRKQLSDVGRRLKPSYTFYIWKYMKLEPSENWLLLQHLFIWCFVVARRRTWIT